MLRFSKILVANRGEIASRIIRTTKKMGIQSLVVCNPVDMDANYVKEVLIVMYLFKDRQTKRFS